MMQDAITPEERALAEQQGLVDLAEMKRR